MGLFGALFGGQKIKDLNVYQGTAGQRRDSDTSQFNQYAGIQATDPHNFWNQNYNDYLDQSGLGGIGPAGGLSWENMIGGSGGGGGHATGYAASAGHATETDLGVNADEALQTKMRDDILQGFVGHRRAEMGAATESAVKRSEVAGQLGGMSPAARALMALRARTAGADSVGREAGAFVTDAYGRALDRRGNVINSNAQIRMGNASNDTQASIATAGNRTSASQTNAGIGASMSNAAAGRESAASQFLMGMYDKNLDRNMDRYKLAFDQGRRLSTPIGQQTSFQDPGILSRLAGGVANIGGMISGAGNIGDMFRGGSGDLYRYGSGGR